MTELSIGDKVQVRWPGWNGTGKVVEVGSLYGGRRTYNVKMLDGNRKATTGGFLITNGSFGITPLRLEAVPVPEVKSSLKVLTIARQLARTLGERQRFVTSDNVQAELQKLGYTSKDLGNRAGSIFRQNWFKRLDKTVSSVRPSSNLRRISVWEYTGVLAVQKTKTVSSPTPRFVIEFKGPGTGGNFVRSGNAGSKGVFDALEAAELEALKQQTNMGIRYKYRAVPAA